LYNTKSNLYGESTEKWYYPPYTLNFFWIIYFLIDAYTFEISVVVGS
jgi:hypothetical protein